jgi:hypothetical protein
VLVRSWLICQIYDTGHDTIITHVKKQIKINFEGQLLIIISIIKEELKKILNQIKDKKSYELTGVNQQNPQPKS